MDRTIFPNVDINEQEILNYIKENDGPNSGLNGKYLDGRSLSDFVTIYEYDTILDKLYNETPVVIGRGIITYPNADLDTATGLIFTATLPEHHLHNPVFAGDWELSTSVGFEPGFIVASTYNDALNSNSWQPSGLDNNQNYYVRMRYRAFNHIGHWSFPVNFKVGTISYIVNPAITIEGYPVDVPTGPIIGTSNYEIYGIIGNHESTDWIIEDINNSIVWSSTGDTINLVEINIPIGVLDVNTDYIIKVRHNSDRYSSNFSYINFRTKQNTYNRIFMYGPSLSNGLRLMRSTQLADGTVLISGGITNDYNSLVSDKTHILDINANIITESDTMTYTRYGHGQSLLLDGNVFVSGGTDINNNILNSCEIYYNGNKQWNLISNLPNGIMNHAQVTLKDGTIMIIGGKSNIESATSNVQVYTPVSQQYGTWSTGPKLNIPRTVHTASVLPDGKVLVCGGLGVAGIALNSCELLDPEAAVQKWILVQDMPNDRVAHNQSTLANGNVLITGGVNSSGYYHTSNLIYNTNTNNGLGSWTTLNGLNTPRKNHSQSTLKTGRVIIIAGFNGSTNLNSTEIFY